MDSDMIANIQELNAKDKGLVRHIIDFFKNLLQKVRDVYAKLNPDSIEGRYVRNMKDVLSELHSKWIEAVKTTSQNISSAQISATKNTATNDGVIYSERYRASIVNESIMALSEKVDSGIFKDNEKVFLGIVDDVVANEIEILTGINVKGYKIALEARQIEHIKKDHGENGKSDHSMADNRDIAKVEFALKDYDSLIKAGKTSAYTYMNNGRNKTADTIMYEKSIGEKSYYVVQAVPETKSKTLYIVTAFIGKSGYKKRTSQLINAKSPDATSKDGSVVVPNNSISDTDAKINSNIKKSERDAEYLEAVNNGDMKTAQRMVDEAAKDNGYTIKAYHGTRKADFTVFRRNVNYFSSNPDVAQSYAPNDEMYSVYLKMQNPFVFNAKNNKWSKIPVDNKLLEILDTYGSSHFREDGAIRTSVADIVSAIEDGVDEGEFNYDGVIIKNVDDTGSYYKNKNDIIGDDYIVFNRNNIKSADLVTYDDNGNVIPLSERFKEDNQDIRYSVRGTLDNIEQSFGINKVNDYIHVQKQVIQTLSKEGFFDNNVVTVIENGMSVEITKDGIKETLGPGKRYQKIPRIFK